MSDIGALRDIREDELEIMRAWRNAPSVRANMYTRHEITAEEHRKWWRAVQQSADKRYFIYELAGAPMGIVGFTGIDTKNEQAFWAFYASPDVPKGTGTKMEFLALNYAFDALKLHKLSCEVLGSNTSVIKLHQKFGFMIEGVFREQHKIDDHFVDVYRLGILSSEWDALRPSMKAKLEKLNRG
jgi:UDP-4-amino-4,6-dideoxy-N-acetyl-beta-L-altrosamine N-acetyltransferase